MNNAIEQLTLYEFYTTNIYTTLTLTKPCYYMEMVGYAAHKVCACLKLFPVVVARQMQPVSWRSFGGWRVRGSRFTSVRHHQLRLLAVANLLFRFAFPSLASTH